MSESSQDTTRPSTALPIREAYGAVPAIPEPPVSREMLAVFMHAARQEAIYDVEQTVGRMRDDEERDPGSDGYLGHFNKILDKIAALRDPEMKIHECSEANMAVRSLKRIEAELEAGAIAHDRLAEVQQLAWEIVELVAAHGGVRENRETEEPEEDHVDPARGDGDDLDDEVHDYVLVHPGCLRRDIVDYIAGRDGAAFNSADVAESVAELIIEGRLKSGKWENTVEVAATGCEDDSR